MTRAAHLAKADLATSLVKELTELQGVMGREYALASHEDPSDATAIYEHYLPRFAGDDMPSSSKGVVLAVTDRLDTLAAAFAAGLEPTGSSDPFGLRRAGLGMIMILDEVGYRASTIALIEMAAHYLPIDLDADRRKALSDFLVQRLRVWLHDQGYRRETVAAVLSVQSDYVAYAVRSVRALDAALGRADFQRVMAGIKRADRIVPREQRLTLRHDLEEALVEPAERELLSAYHTARSRIRGLRSFDIDGLVQGLLPLADPIDRFFTDVMVMSENETIRAARLALLYEVRELPHESFEVAQVPLPRS